MHREPGRESSSAALSLPTAPARPSRCPPRGGGRRAAGSLFLLPDPFCAPASGLGSPHSVPAREGERAAEEASAGEPPPAAGAAAAHGRGARSAAPQCRRLRARGDGPAAGAGEGRRRRRPAMKGRRRGGCPRLARRALTSRRTISPAAPAPALPLPAARPT